MRILVLFLTFLLSACGFKPLYASLEGEAAGGSLGTIYVEAVRGPPEARDLMRDRLQKRLPPRDGDERYTVTVDLVERRQGVSVNIDSSTRRFNYTLNARVIYRDKETGVGRRQNLQSIASFAVVPSQYASLVAREDAVRRAVVDLARKIETDAVLYVQGQAPVESDDTLFQTNNGEDSLRRLEREADRERREEAENGAGP